jgi:hypothetical protein
MFDYQTVKLLHLHGEDDYVPMREQSEHGSEAHNPERSWLRGAKIFKCSRCDETIVMTPASGSNSEAPGQVG